MLVTHLRMTDTMNPIGIYISTVTICTTIPHLEQGSDDDNTKLRH